MTPNHLKTHDFAHEVSVESKRALTLIPKLNPLAVILGGPELRIDHYGQFSGKLRFFMIQVAKHVGNA